MQHSNMPQRQAPNPRMANMRANAANQITKLKQEQLRQQVWGPGSANSLNPKPAAPAAPPAAAAEPEHDDMAAYRTYQANGGAAGAEARARGYNKGGKAKKFAKGGAVKAYAKGGTVKKSGASRGDGCAQRGHTKGKMK